MKKLLACISSFLIFAGGFSFPISALAQNASVASACSAQTLPVGYLNGTLIVKQNGDLCTNATGGGGGSSAVTATAAAPTYVEGSSTNPVSSDLHGSQRMLILDASGAAVDWTAPTTVTGTVTVAGVSGTVSLPTGAATEASLAKLTLGQTSTTSGQTGPLVQGSVTTAAPTYTTGQTSPLSLTTAGELRVNFASGGISTAANQTSVIGSKAPGTAAASALLTGGVFTSGGVTLTDGQQANLALDSSGRLITSATISGNLTVQGAGAAGTPATGVVTVQGITSMTPFLVTATGNVASAGTDSGNPVKVGGLYNSTAPTFTNGQRGDLQLEASGALRVSAGGTTANGADAVTNSNQVKLQSATTIGTSGQTQVALYAYNTSTWDRVRGDTTGLAVQPYGLSGAHWNYAAAASGISNTTTAVTIKTAAGASVKNCITSIQLSDDTLGAATEFAIRDGVGGTVLWRTKLQTTALSAQPGIDFPAAICGTANTLLEVVTLTASITGSVYFNAQGFTAP